MMLTRADQNRMLKLIQVRADRSRTAIAALKKTAQSKNPAAATWVKISTQLQKAYGYLRDIEQILEDVALG